MVTLVCAGISGLLLGLGWLLDEAGCGLVAQRLLMVLCSFVLKVKNFRLGSYGIDFGLGEDDCMYGLCIV